jgi:tetrahydromethanopterin:alpha-L-glutamate ligase
LTRGRLRIAVVGIGGGWSSETLADAVSAITGFRLLVEMSRCVVDLASGRVMHGDTDLCELDAIVVKKLDRRQGPHMLDYLEILRYVQGRGVRVFSSPLNMLRLLDRLSCSLTLAASGIPLPATTITHSIPDAVAAIERYGEAVLKPLYSSKAQGMQIVSSRESSSALETRLTAFKKAGNALLYVQERVTIADRDLGLIFLGGEHVGTYARVKSAGSWNTSAREGGHYETHQASADLIELAWRAQALFQLDLTTVDVVETPDGPQVFEVSAFGGFRGAREGLGIDVAQRYALYVMGRVTA